MASLLRLGVQLGRGLSQGSSRALSVTATRPLKEIHAKQDGDKLVISGVRVPSPRADLLIRPPSLPAPHDSSRNKCYMCALDLDVKHTDVLILSQFVRSDGCVLPRRITGLCSRQQKRMSKLVAMAQKAGLMINLTPSFCHKDPKRRSGHRAFNTYFDEMTIFAKKPKKWAERFKYYVQQ